MKVKKIKDFKPVSEEVIREVMNNWYKNNLKKDDTYYDYIVGNCVYHVKRIKDKLKNDKSLNRDDKFYLKYRLSCDKGLLYIYYSEYKQYKLNQIQQQKF